MTQAIRPKKLPQEAFEKLNGANLNLCLTCGTCSGGCPITGDPAEDMQGWDTRKVIRMLALGMIDEVVASRFPWLCTGCGRCAAACPMGLDMPAIFGYMKHLRPRDEVPGILHKGVENVLNTGNNMAIPRDDYLFTMADMGVEMADDEWPGFYVPVDRQDASVLFFPNSKEVFGDFEDMYWWWKIFYAAREKWTIPSDNWEAVDWGLFTGNYEATRILAQRKIDMMKKFNIERMIMPDCGGGSYGCRNGMKMCEFDDPDNTVNFIYLYEYLMEIIKQGRIKLDKSVYADKTFTWHDSCKHGRELQSHFGHGFFEEPRWIVNQCVDNFVDMEPNRMNGNCCGAGGGMWPMPYEDDSAWHGRKKYESIKESGADVVVVACSNCHDQLMKRIPKYYEDYPYEVMYLWQLVADCLVIDPYTEEEIAQAEAEAEAQWERLGVDLDMEL
ncbi:MAG: (Fe-S)-binding protein [Desulfarculaceae bacterium]|nr:(Fe-S)-binding protein [Desulfarculaceae bacterium]MCF8072465.1 (Fe-S)-binding protein [Desulfarculaceae bacterium]MCF8102926.1 (Fe-S)-binding protein [Desulfarculaceae bacterium]MCF8117471.1 (Fe-S)-binding protein [Desulfarculaceae bacterium]